MPKKNKTRKRKASAKVQAARATVRRQRAALTEARARAKAQARVLREARAALKSAREADRAANRARIAAARYARDKVKAQRASERAARRQAMAALRQLGARKATATRRRQAEEAAAKRRAAAIKGWLTRKRKAKKAKKVPHKELVRPPKGGQRYEWIVTFGSANVDKTFDVIAASATEAGAYIAARSLVQATDKGARALTKGLDALNVARGRKTEAPEGYAQNRGESEE